MMKPILIVYLIVLGTASAYEPNYFFQRKDRPTDVVTELSALSVIPAVLLVTLGCFSSFLVLRIWYGLRHEDDPDASSLLTSFEGLGQRVESLMVKQNNLLQDFDRAITEDVKKMEKKLSKLEEEIPRKRHQVHTALLTQVTNQCSWVEERLAEVNTAMEARTLEDYGRREQLKAEMENLVQKLRRLKQDREQRRSWSNELQEEIPRKRHQVDTALLTQVKNQCSWVEERLAEANTAVQGRMLEEYARKKQLKAEMKNKVQEWRRLKQDREQRTSGSNEAMSSYMDQIQERPDTTYYPQDLKMSLPIEWKDNTV